MIPEPGVPYVGIQGVIALDLAAPTLKVRVLKLA